MRGRNIVAIWIFLAGFVSLSAGANGVRVGWYLGGFRLTVDPVFETKGVQKSGTVMVLLELSSDGAVKQMTSINGSLELQEVVQESVKSWRFVAVPGLPATLRGYVSFSIDDGPGLTAPGPPPPPFGEPLGSLEIEGVSSEVRERLAKSIGLQSGSMVTQDSLRKARLESGKIDPALVLVMTLGKDGRPKLRISPRPRSAESVLP
jgi:hypothetical protein